MKINQTRTPLCALVMSAALAACGSIETGISASSTSASASAALEKDPSGGPVSVISAAAAELPPPAEDELPLPDCEHLSHEYQYIQTQINGLVTYHALYSLPSYQASGAAANAANKQKCGLSFAEETDCGTLMGTFYKAFDSLRKTEQYQALDRTGEWHALLVAYRNLKSQSCIDP